MFRDEDYPCAPGATCSARGVHEVPARRNDCCCTISLHHAGTPSLSGQCAGASRTGARPSVSSTASRVRYGIFLSHGLELLAAAPARCWRHGEWGAKLPRFLLDRGVEAWWVDLTRIEWAVHQAERARDDVFDAESLALLAQLDPQEITLLLRGGSSVLRVHPYAWTCWQDPVHAFAKCENENWESQQPALHILVCRAPWQAHVQLIGSAEAAFMSALIRGMSLAQALAATHCPTNKSSARSANIENTLDFEIWLQRALSGGWLVGAAVMVSGDCSLLSRSK